MQKKLSRRAFLFGRRIADDESGATAVEYGLIAGLIAVGIVGGLTKVGFTNKERMRCVKRGLDGKRRGRACQRVGVK